MSVHVPNLKKKLVILYRNHLYINTNKKLADYLSISPNTISVWCNGNPTLRENMVPEHRFASIVKLFDISADIFTQNYENIQDFQGIISSKTLNTQMWSSLQTRAEYYSGLELIASTGQRLEYPVGDYEAFEPRYQDRDPVYIRYVLNERWQSLASQGKAYMTVMNIDPNKVHCLCPSSAKSAPTPKLTQPIFTIPVDAESNITKRISVSGPTGKHTIMCLVTQEPLPSDLVDDLLKQQTELDKDSLNIISCEIMGRKVDSWEIHKAIYHVIS